MRSQARNFWHVFFALKKCEIYILGYAYVIYTDHKPLTSLKSFKDVNRRYRWIQYLEDLGAKIRYLLGKKM